MERYSSYKPTSIQWLKEIPSHWEFVKLKFYIDYIESGVSVNGNVSSPAEGDEYGVLKTGCVSKRYFDPKENKSVNREEYKRVNCSVKAGTIIVSRMNTPDLVGACAYVEKDYPNLFLPDRLWQVHIKESANAKFLHWVLNSKYVRDRYSEICIGSSSTMQNISQKQFSDTMVLLPPLAEQEKIVSYLDSKTSKIDAYVADKEKEIQLLQELKQKTIAEAVTKGLNPNVKMKDSRTLLFGQIPVHWDERKIKYCFDERSEKNHPDEQILCATQSQGVIPQSMYQNRVVVVNKGFEGLKFVKEGDFVISLRSFEGGIEYAYYQGIISAAYTILTPRNKCCTDYFKLLFKCYPFIQVLQTCVTGIREGQNINYQMLGRQYIPLPPITEQQSIVSYIEQKSQKVDTLITELQAEIDYLKEYKQRLIADCVTGQMNVQNEK